MQYRQLGRSGLRVSSLSLGTMTFGGRGDFAKVGSTDTAVARRQVDECLDARGVEAAIEAAHLVKARYAEEPFSVTLDAPGVEVVNQADTPLKNFIPEIAAGDADKAFAFRRAFKELETRIKLFTQLPIASLDQPTLREKLRAIGQQPTKTEG